MLFVDVSEYQGTINWPLVAKYFKAAYIKASEGLTWNDPRFQENRADANKYGVHVGAYHFTDVTNAVAEAEHFVSTIGRVGPRDLKPVLDFEVNPHGLSAVDLRVFTRKFNQTVYAKTGVLPMFYSYAGFIEGMKFAAPVGNGLWIAAYGRNDGKEYPVYAPAPWKKYQAHQFTSDGVVRGIKGHVDISDSPNGLWPLLAHPFKAAPLPYITRGWFRAKPW
ncbi:MAG: glycoside hydrolase family 25 protein [Patescibacteria group bacterium]|nr:glycoside hydrolase family 25 protein [Patescibacteria group bacterium]